MIRAKTDDPSPVILASTSSIPHVIRQRLEKIGLADARFLFAAEADLNRVADIMPVWLLAGEDFVVSVPADSHEPVAGPFQYKDIRSFDLKSTVGSTSLRANVDGISVELARFTNEFRERFQRVLSQLSNLKQKKPFEPEALLRHDPNLCPQCGLVLPTPASRCPKCFKQHAIFHKLLLLLKPYSFWVGILLVLMITGIILDLTPPYLIRILINDVLGARTHLNWLVYLVAALAVAALCRAGLNILISILASYVGTRLTYNVRNDLFDKLSQMSVEYYDKARVGNLMSRVVNDVQVLHSFVTQITSGFVLNIFLVIGIGTMLFYLDYKTGVNLAFWVLLPIPAVFAGTVFFWKKIYPLYYRFRDSNSKITSMLNGVLNGIRLVKAFGQERRETARFEKSARYMRDSLFAVDIRSGMFYPVIGWIFGLGGLIVWYVGGQYVIAGKGGIRTGDLIAYISYIAMFYAPLSNLAIFSNWLTQFMTSSQRIFEILDMEPTIADKEDAVQLDGSLRGNVVFENVTFGYDPYNPVINNVSMSIKEGQTIGIVGKSGHGKTTLVNLLCRFYDIQKGRILIDGHDIRDLRRTDIRNNVGLVLQEPFLFLASVAANIAYGRPDASARDIINAARAANAHDFIMRLPSGYDTRLGERGAGLSGGEKQRIGIARAILCNPKILILDEATSSVYTESEQQIQRSIEALCKGRTAIIIAHRLNTLKNADKIFVIELGRIAEEGSHKELMEKKGIYYNLVKIQSELASISEKE